MISGSRKRKHRFHRSHPSSTFQGSSYPKAPYGHSEILDESAGDITSKPDPLHALYIQAYEADVVRGSHAQTAAQSLEIVVYTPTTIIPKIGTALIRWGGETSIGKCYGDGGGDEDDMLPVATQDTETAIWVDRYVRFLQPSCSSARTRRMSLLYIWYIQNLSHNSEVNSSSLPLFRHSQTHFTFAFVLFFRYDARLLLETLPNSNPRVSTGTVVEQPDSPTGWSDLPSDTEDTFFFSPDETEDFRREKRRRLLEQTREERLKARMEEDQEKDEEGQEEEDVWGGSDEEVRVIFFFSTFEFITTT